MKSTNVYFNGFNRVRICGLYQYDYGQVLVFPDLPLPATYEVQFAPEGAAQTVTQIGDANGVQIPDEYLTGTATINAYIFLHEASDDGETVYRTVIPVLPRPEPSDIEPTPVQQDVITQAIAALNTAVNEAEGYAQDAQEAAESIPEHVLVYDAQSLTNAEKTQARANIGAANANYEIRNLADGSYNHSIRMTSSAPESDYAEGHLGGYASAFGFNTKASGGGTLAEGWSTEASNTAAHAEGRDTVSSGQASHAEGLRSVASASQAHAEGRDTVAGGTISHAQGEGTIASHRAQTVAGQFNIADPSTGAATERGTYIEIIGNGVDANTRSNARTLDWDGNEVLSGKLTVGADAVNEADVPTLAQVQGMIPTVPTNVSAFNNDVGYQTASDVNTALLASLITDTASGDPCAIPDGASAPVVDCTVAIMPKQEGSGTPSPSNIRPISGWTEMTLRRTGFNIWDEEWESGFYNNSGVPEASTTNIRSKNAIGVKPSTAYYAYIVGSPSLKILYYDANDTLISYETKQRAVLTTPANCASIRFSTINYGGSPYRNDICINVSNASVNGTYEPHNGQTYTKSWTPTVYGGELDLTTGVLTVTYGIVDLGSLAWTVINSTYGTFQSSIADAKVPTGGSQVANCLHPYYVVVSSNAFNNVANTGYFVVNSSDHFVRFCTGDSSIQPSGGLVYELAEPTTVQLTPTEVQTILGSNTFSADTGAVTVEYKADTELWVEGHVPSKTSQLTNDSGFITASNAPVRSVNGKTGAVTIANATTSANGLMSATDKANLDTLMDDYSSAMTALGV